MTDTSGALTRQEQRYSPLSDYLSGVSPDQCAVMSFAEIEKVIGCPLPTHALENVDWWRPIPKTPQGRSWLRADRRADVDLRAETVAFVFEVFKRGQSLDELKLMRDYWLAFARRELAAPGNFSNVERGWWEPHLVYLIHFAAEATFKVGLTRIGSTRVHRLAGRRGQLVDSIEVANRWAALVVEHHVLELIWDAWKRPDRFATGDQGETERWSDWLVPPPLSVVRDSLTEDQQSPGWELSVFRKES